VVEPEVIIVPIVFGFPTAAIMLWTWARHREKMAALKAPTEASSSSIEQRLGRVENAVEAIAVEIERIGESQRFLTKVLTDSRPGLTAGSSDSGGGPLVQR
jgi:hypothetical protein